MKKMFKNIAIALCAAMTILTAVGCSDANTNTIVTQNAVSATETTVTEPVSSVQTEPTATAAEVTIDDAADINAVQNKLQYHTYYKNFDPNKCLVLKHEQGKFHVSDLKTWYFYDFNTVCAVGVGENGDTTHIAYRHGIKAEITDNRTLTVSSTKGCSDIRIAFENDKVQPKYTVRENNNKLTASADLWDTSFPNGLYSITGTIDGSDTTMYLFINCASNAPSDYHFNLCYGEDHYRSEEFNPTARREALTSLLDRSGVTPENALNTNYNYPCMATASNNDVQYWIDKSHEILGNSTAASNSVKALLLHDWMTSNLKYDFYKVNVLHIQRYYVDRKLNPNEYVSKNYTGVCLDFSSIYAIMCRENGIPCVVLNNDSHAWNAIYIHDRWYEVDLTIDTNRFVYDENTNRVTGSRLYCYDGFCMPNVNDEVADTATRFCW